MALDRYDIFGTDESSKYIWLESAPTIEVVEQRLKTLREQYPSLLVSDAITGVKMDAEKIQILIEQSKGTVTDLHSG